MQCLKIRSLNSPPKQSPSRLFNLFLSAIWNNRWSTIEKISLNTIEWVHFWARFFPIWTLHWKILLPLKILHFTCQVEQWGALVRHVCYTQKRWQHFSRKKILLARDRIMKNWDHKMTEQVPHQLEDQLASCNSIKLLTMMALTI